MFWDHLNLLLGHLRDGKVSCRCSKSYRWTKEQKEYNISKVLEEDNIIFVSWKNKDRVNLKCNTCGKEWDTLYYNVVSGGNRCPVCSRHECKEGFYIGKGEVEDYLYLLKFTHEKESFIKVGRSFNIANRVRDFPSYYNVEVLGYVKDTHKGIYELEHKTHCILRKNNLHYTPNFKFGGSVKECFLLEALTLPEIDKLFQITP